MPMLRHRTFLTSYKYCQFVYKNIWQMKYHQIQIRSTFYLRADHLNGKEFKFREIRITIFEIMWSLFEDVYFVMPMERVEFSLDSRSFQIENSQEIMLLQTMIEPESPIWECEICYGQYTKYQFYSFNSCGHHFCRLCCLRHIEARLQIFCELTCPKNNCKAILSENSCLFSLLDETKLKKIKKYRNYVKVQKNRDLKMCMKEDCEEIIDISILGKRKGKGKNLGSIICLACKSKHCATCFQLNHEDPELCPVAYPNFNKEEQENMLKMKIRRCPSCMVWVQKNGGCRYLRCKCGTSFCFHCVVAFDKDPCRKFKLKENDRQIRWLLTQTNPFRKPRTLLQALLFLPKFAFNLVIFLFLTILLGSVYFIMIFGFMAPLIFLLAPAALIAWYGQTSLSFSSIWILRILTFALLPLVGLVAVLLMVFIIISYPFARTMMPNEAHDTMDNLIYPATVWYLKGIVCVFAL